MNRLILSYLLVFSQICLAGSPVIWKGDRTGALPSKGIVLSDNTTIDNDGDYNGAKNARAEFNTTAGWSAYADAAATAPVDCTAGSPDTALTNSSSSPLEGTRSFLITKNSGASRQGEGAALAFTLPATYANSMIGLSYAVSGSANYTADDAVMYIYDVTNSALITPQETTIEASGYYRSVFAITTGTSYRACYHVASAVDESWTLKIDDINIGWSKTVQGAAVSDWQSFTPTGLWANSTYTGKYKRVGDTAEFDIRIATTASDPGAGSLYVNLPITIDTGKLLSSSAGDTAAISDLGSVCVDAGAGQYPARVSYKSTTSLYVSYSLASGTPTRWADLDKSTPFAFGANDYVDIKFKVPVLEWSSGVYLGSGADSRVSPLNWTSCSTNPGLYYGASAATNVSATSCKVSRLNDTLLAQVIFTFNGAANANGNINWTTPNALTADSTKLAGTEPIGVAAFHTNSKIYSGYVQYSGGAIISPWDGTGSATANWAGNTTAGSNVPSGAAIANNDTLRISYKIPITGWTAQDYLGKVAAGFLQAKVGTPGLVNNDSSNVTGTPIKGVTDGSSATAGYVGQVVTPSPITSFTNWPAALDNGDWGDMLTIPLTAGEWLITGSILTYNNGAVTAGVVSIGIGATAGNAAPTTYGGYLAQAIIPTTSGNRSSLTFPFVYVSITGAGTINYYLKATWSAANTNFQNMAAAQAIRIR